MASKLIYPARIDVLDATGHTTLEYTEDSVEEAQERFDRLRGMGGLLAITSTGPGTEQPVTELPAPETGAVTTFLAPLQGGR